MGKQAKLEIEVRIPRLLDSYIEEEDIENKLINNEFESEEFVLKTEEANEINYKFFSGPGTNKMRINIQGFYKKNSDEIYNFYKKILDSNKYVSNIKFYFYEEENGQEILLFESKNRVKEVLDIFYEEKALSNDKNDNQILYLLTFLGESVV